MEHETAAFLAVVSIVLWGCYARAFALVGETDDIVLRKLHVENVGCDANLVVRKLDARTEVKFHIDAKVSFITA